MTASALPVVALVASLFMAWSIGASSNSASISPAVGADALSVGRAAILVGVVASLGAIAQGASISETIRTGFIDGATLSPLATAAILLTSATALAVGVKTGYPISACFTVTGATIGAGLALGGSIATDTLTRVVTFWALIPVVEVAIAFAVGYVLICTDIPDTVSIPGLAGIIGFTVVNVPFTFLPESRLGHQSFAGHVADLLGFDGSPFLGGYGIGELLVGLAAAGICLVIARELVLEAGDDGVHPFLIGLGLLVTFAAGGSQVGLAVGPLAPALEGLGITGFAILVIGAIGMTVGSVTGAPRLIRAVSHEYSELDEHRAIAALFPAFLVAQAAIRFGVPVSFNAIMIAALLGSGLVDGRESVSEAKTINTVLAWGGSMALGAAVTYGLYTLAAAVLTAA